MSFVNALMRVVFDAALAPFRSWHPLVGITVVSLVIAIAMLLIFKRTSDQDAIDRVKRKIHAGLFEIRLYNDDLLAILQAQWDILRHNATYVRLSLIPLLWMIVPLVLCVAQLQFHYGYSGLMPGDSAVLKVQLADASTDDDPFAPLPPKPATEIDVPDGLTLETPAVWAATQNELAWRLRADREGDYELTIRIDGAEATKTVHVGEGTVRRSPFRVRGFFDELIYPAEAPLPAGTSFTRITLAYPDAEIDVFGARLHWMIVFLVLSIVFAFGLRGVFGVKI